MSAVKKTNTIHVVFAADANYVMPLAVAMCSAAINCDRTRQLVFYVFQDGIGPDLREKVEVSLLRTGFPDARVNWLEAPIESVADLKVGHYWTNSLVFVRLLIPNLFAVELEKVIYLDCDIVVNEDLGDLWDTDLDGKSLLAAEDCNGTVSNPMGGLSNYHELGIPADAKYFNAGVLVMNLKKWRQNQTTDRLLAYMRDYEAIIRTADQEALNAVLWDDWAELDYRWNSQIIWRGHRIGTHKPTWTPPSTRKSIIHFISAEKPWLPGCDYDERKYYFEYLDRTEWAGWRVPWFRELHGRLRRAWSDAKDAQGRWRRRILARIADAIR